MTILATASPAHAQQRVDLRVDLPPEALHCLHQSSLADGIDLRVREEGLPSGALVEIRGERTSEAAWRLAVAIAVDGEPIGERELIVEESECETAVDAIALVVVLALRGSHDPAEDATEAAASAERVAEPPISPVQQPLARVALPSEPADRDPAASLVVRLRGDGGAALGTDGRVAAIGGFGLELGVAARWSIGALAIGRFPSSVEVVGGELVVTTLGARVYGCVDVLDAAPVALEPCAAAMLGMQRTAARRFDVENGTSSDLIATAAVGARLRLQLSDPVYFQVELLGEVPLVRPALAVQNEAGAEVDVYRSPILTLMPTLGLGVALR